MLFRSHFPCFERQTSSPTLHNFSFQHLNIPKYLQNDEKEAFGLLREGLLSDLYEKKSSPYLNVYSDQIVWGRSPVRIDVAGGWTDTPPYSLFAGGNVVNLAIELNGQPPLQVYVKPCKEYRVVLRSIDMGAMEVEIGRASCRERVCLYV